MFGFFCEKRRKHQSLVARKTAKRDKCCQNNFFRTKTLQTKLLHNEDLFTLKNPSEDTFDHLEPCHKLCTS